MNEEQEFFITASMGIAIYPQDGEEAELLLKNADLAMYISKEKGKNQYTLCSPAVKDDVLRKMMLTNSLFRAQERNELVLYYQLHVRKTSIFSVYTFLIQVMSDVILTSVSPLTLLYPS